MTTSIITASYNNAITVSFTSDAWFNATEVAKQFSKKPIEWLRLESTIDYIDSLVEIQKWEIPTFDKNQLVTTKKGSSENGGGSWFHPKLAIAFARWLDVKFSIWCDMQIEKLLHPVPYGLKEQPATISNKQIGELFTRVCEISNDGKIRTAIWSRFQNHFRVNSYKLLPAEKYDEALDYLEKLRAEYNPKPEPVLTENHYRRVMNRADFLSKTQCATPLLTLVETIRKEFKVSDIRKIPEAKFAKLCQFLNFSPEQNERDLLVDYFRASDLVERMKQDYIILKKDDPCIVIHFVQQVDTLLLPELISQSAEALAVRL